MNRFPTYATPAALEMFATGTPEAVVGWTELHLVDAQSVHDFLHEASWVTAAMLRRLAGPRHDPSQTWSTFVAEPDAAPERIVALQMLTAAVNEDGQSVDAHIHAALDRGISDPAWVSRVVGEVIVQAGRWVRTLRTAGSR